MNKNYHLAQLDFVRHSVEQRLHYRNKHSSYAGTETRHLLDEDSMFRTSMIKKTLENCFLLFFDNKQNFQQ